MRADAYTTRWRTCGRKCWRASSTDDAEARWNGGGEIVTNLNFLFAAYTAVWVLLFLYILMVARRNRALQRELEELRQLLERRNPS